MVQRDQWDTYWGAKKIISLIRDIDDATMAGALFARVSYFFASCDDEAGRRRVRHVERGALLDEPYLRHEASQHSSRDQ